jgi:outer membrane protein insertion porin family
LRLWSSGSGALRVLGAALFLSLAMIPDSSVVKAAEGGAAEGGTVAAIRIEGTQRIEPETVRSYLMIQPGDPFDQGRIDRSLKSLFATGLFADVSLRREGDTLVVQVVENPIINRIAFEGNHKFDDKALSAELQLRPRVVYTRTKVQADVKRILELYRRSGRFAATVEPKVVPLDQNRVDLVFEIEEGSLTGIKSITFIGNRQFDDSRLRGVIQTKESRWYRFFSTDDTYDPDRLTYDRELLRKFYLSQGYADFRVVSAIAELAPSRDGFYVTYTIEEGERYKFGKINLTSKIKDVSAEELMPLVTVKEGDWYDAEEVEHTVTQLTDALGNRGYAFVDIRPRPNRNREARTVDVAFDIQEGPRVYVERIDITGNVRTLDKVIRREFRLVEGDAFNTSKLRRSEQRLKDLGFFKKVEVNNVQGSAPDQTVITVEVEEQSTGELSLGAGFSTTDGLLGDVAIREKNFLGRGQDLRLAFTLSQRAQQVDISFTEPYFLDKNLAAGFDLFQIDQKNQINALYDQFTIGGALRMGYQITEPLRQTLKYELREDSITNVQSTASDFIMEEEGSRVSSSVGQVLLYDKRDSRLDPSGGYFLSYGTDIAGLGGDARYVRNKVSGAWYYSVSKDWVFSLSSEAGIITGLGQNVLIEDRFFVGGDNLRGFKTAGIGPRDSITHDALGGNQYYVGSAQLGFPLGLPPELGISGRVFSDFGDLWGIDEHVVAANGATILNANTLRVSGGFGLSWKSPFGPIRLDFGIPIRRESYDQSELFRVGFGTRF